MQANDVPLAGEIQQDLQERRQEILGPAFKFTQEGPSSALAQIQILEDVLEFYKVGGVKLAKFRPELLEKLGELATHTCKLKHGIGQQRASLDQLRREYQPSTQAYDFEGKLRSSSQHAVRYNPQADAELQEVLARLRGDDSVGGDDVMFDTNAEDELGILNNQCPITMADVMELEDPVEDKMGYVYSMAAMKQYILQSQQGDQGVECPVHGATHKVRLQDLRPSRKVAYARRAQKMGGPRQQKEVDIVL